MAGIPTPISADTERAFLDQIARDSELFKSQYVVQQRHLSAEEILGTVNLLTNWDLHFSRYDPVSAALLSSGRPEMSSRLGDIHAFLRSQTQTFRQMYSDQLHQVDKLNNIIQDAYVDHSSKLLDSIKNSSQTMEQLNQDFLRLLES